MIRALLLGLALGLATPAPAQQVAYGSLTQPRQIAVILDAVERGDIALAERLLAGAGVLPGMEYDGALMVGSCLDAGSKRPSLCNARLWCWRRNLC